MGWQGFFAELIALYSLPPVHACWGARRDHAIADMRVQRSACLATLTLWAFGETAESFLSSFLDFKVIRRCLTASRLAFRFALSEYAKLAKNQASFGRNAQ
jgi:hypothetical protein